MTNMYTVNRAPLASDWNTRRPDGYDVVVIGSGYGGAITAARIATAQWPDPKPTICILERGKEWLPGQFPDNLLDGAPQVRSDSSPLGLYDFYIGADIGVIKGSGLGGTSLVNANVAYQPDDDLFDNPQWPQAIRDARDSGKLQEYFDRVRVTLFADRHPHGMDLSKVKALKKGAEGRPNSEFDLLNIAVNFAFEGRNNWGVQQRKCINCGDCITGCNVGAKNTLDTNYLAIAKSGGAGIFTQVEVNRVEKDPAGYLIHYVRRDNDGGATEQGTLKAKRTVILSAGALGSTAIMLRSREQGLSLSNAVGTRFSGNGDFFGLAYNGDARTDVLGWGAYPDSDRARRIQPAPGQTLYPGPTIVARIRYGKDKALQKRITVEDLSFPLMYVDAARAAFAIMIGRDTDSDDFFDTLDETGRRLLDVGAFNPELEKGALNYTMLYLVMGYDDAGGRIELDANTGQAAIRWPGVGDQGVFQRENNLLLEHATALGADFIENPIWGFTPARTLFTAHPLGGCPMGENQTTGLVNDSGQVFDEHGIPHDGLYIADGSIVPTAIGVNPFLTISALSERIAESVTTSLGGTPVVVTSL